MRLQPVLPPSRVSHQRHLHLQCVLHLLQYDFLHLLLLFRKNGKIQFVVYLQNIPVRGEDGKEIRKAFVPEPGCEFFSADYSQIELRVMAHLSGDENMIEAFREGHDIHAATAAKIYKETIDEVSRDQRTKAKRANFGIIYGITVFGLAERLEISRDEAKKLIEGYFENFPKVKEYMDKSIQMARTNGYAETLFHRRRYLADINSHNATVRGFAERNAINAPIQGTAADIIKVAMINVYRRFRKIGRAHV